MAFLLLNIYVFVIVWASASTFDISRVRIDDDFTNKPVPPSNRIVDGAEVPIEEFPHQVALSIGTKFHCGGSIISENWIVTAAHCLKNVVPSLMVVRAGSDFYNEGTVINIEILISHPHYIPGRLDNDIAVMKTIKPINFGPTIRPIALPEVGGQLEPNSEIEVSGWGRTMEAGVASKPLLAATLKVLSYEQCKLSYGDRFTENMWCAGFLYPGGKSTCSGDSGGGAIQDGKLQGVVSFGRRCGSLPLSPSVFSSVFAPSNRIFINEATGL